MKQPVYTKQFEKDLKRMLKRGKNADKLKTVVRLLLADEQLDIRYRDHTLSGNYNNRRECHIEPDWLLIYKPEEERIIFERTGTHSDLF
jgi:mRNA interferase YafQ